MLASTLFEQVNNASRMNENTRRENSVLAFGSHIDLPL